MPIRAKVNDYSVAFNGFSAKLIEGSGRQACADPGRAPRLASTRCAPPTRCRPRRSWASTGSDGVWQKQFGGNANAGRGHHHRRPGLGHLAREPVVRPAARAAPRPSRHRRRSGRASASAGVEAADRLQQQADRRPLLRRRRRQRHQPSSSDSPRDTNGHGSHTASTAAGNHGVPAIDQRRRRRQHLRHGAGRAHRGLQGAAGTNADGHGLRQHRPTSWHAIDDAVADGVDVINYSISGSTHLRRRPGRAGLPRRGRRPASSSPTSAGNSGDTVGVDASPTTRPWLITVAASTHDRGVHQDRHARQRRHLQRPRRRPGACPAPAGRLGDRRRPAPGAERPPTPTLCLRRRQRSTRPR